MGILGNEKADAAAKSALSLPVTRMKLPATGMYPRITKLIYECIFFITITALASTACSAECNIFVQAIVESRTVDAESPADYYQHHRQYHPQRHVSSYN